MHFNSNSNVYTEPPYLAPLSTNSNMKYSLRGGSMIGRVYNVKPGCSACGKKVS